MFQHDFQEFIYFLKRNEKVGMRNILLNFVQRSSLKFRNRDSNLCIWSSILIPLFQFSRLPVYYVTDGKHETGLALMFFQKQTKCRREEVEVRGRRIKKNRCLDLLDIFAEFEI